MSYRKYLTADTPNAALLRPRAEEQTTPIPESVEDLSPDTARRMLHDLQVHQIELEMQNEELRRAQLELEASRARYFDLYDLAPVGYCTISEHGVILQANLTAATLLGVVRRVLVQRPLHQFITKVDQDIYYLCRRELLATHQPQTCELRMRKPDGSLLWVRLSATTAQDHDSTTLRIALSDITTPKQLEAELIKAVAAAEKANQAKSAFLSNMSHELRTPLSSIIGFAQLLEIGAPAPTPEQKQSLERILRAGWHLLELINELLDLDLIGAGKLSISLASVPLHEVMHECQLMIEAQAKRLDLRLLFPPIEQQHFVEADRLRLKQILLNLLDNAVKYNKPHGAVSVSFLVTPQRRLRLCIEDSGYGLTPEELAQLFQPFQRLGQESNAIPGTGVGLVISKRLVEMMGGAIGAESTAGRGSIFWVELNLTTEADKQLKR